MTQDDTPIRSPSFNENEVTQYQREMVDNGMCPRCRGALDTGWECLECGYDAKCIALSIYPLSWGG
jgi:hypothetical protein